MLRLSVIQHNWRFSKRVCLTGLHHPVLTLIYNDSKETFPPSSLILTSPTVPRSTVSSSNNNPNVLKVFIPTSQLLCPIRLSGVGCPFRFILEEPHGCYGVCRVDCEAVIDTVLLGGRGKGKSACEFCEWVKGSTGMKMGMEMGIREGQTDIPGRKDDQVASFECNSDPLLFMHSFCTSNIKVARSREDISNLFIFMQMPVQQFSR